LKLRLRALEHFLQLVQNTIKTTLHRILILILLPCGFKWLITMILPGVNVQKPVAPVDGFLHALRGLEVGEIEDDSALLAAAFADRNERNKYKDAKP
jgi:hypothetical protein